MKDLTIGITINIKPDDNIWNNGIVQNVINLALVLKNSQNNYNVMILNTSEVNQLEYKIDEVSIYPIKDKITTLDILFITGSQIYDSDYNYLRNKGCKIIYYSCGTNYIIDMQEILFRDNTDKRLYKHIPDEVWMIPQNMNVNKYYFETIYKKKVKEIPFIWSPLFVDYVINEHKIKGFYTPSDEPKRISCFEPNIDVVKFAMYDILIVEQAYRERPDLIKHFYVTNAGKIKSNPCFVNIMNELDVVKNGIATFEGRFRMPYFLDTYTDIVVAHQWENPLNYAYLEALYLEYPIIHNASMIKDGGYYYDGFNVDKGKEQLLYALSEHDKHIDEYDKRSKKVLKRYLPTNAKSIEIYDNLIDDLYKK